MEITKISREKLYRREYEKDSSEVVLGAISEVQINNSLTKVLGKMLQEVQE
jgi:hypothetical protein